MIKVENDMLVLDSTFTKDDVKAIDEFVKINVDRERQRILDEIEKERKRTGLGFIQYGTLLSKIGETNEKN